MTADLPLHRSIAAARRRRGVIAGLMASAAVVVVIALAWRLHGDKAATLVTLLLAVWVAGFAWRRARALDARWFIRRLDRRVDMEDSADLLFADPAALTGLQSLQRERLRERLAGGAAPDLRPAWPGRTLAFAWLAAAGLVAGIVYWPAIAPTNGVAEPETVAESEAAATHTSLLTARLDIEPPAYTVLPTRGGPELSDKVPAGSRLRWTLRFAPQPPSAEIVLHDGRRIALTREGEDWTGELRLDRSTLYRLVPGGPLPLREDSLHRLDAIADQPPQLRVITPERNLTLRGEGQRDWALSFEATDDHGLGNARLLITLAQGSGEQVTVSERRIALSGEGDGDGKQRRYLRRLDLAAQPRGRRR